MCGITGFWQLDSLTSDLKLDETIKKMANTLSHRGPDDFGIWIDYNLKIALGHRRLSILDVSKAGHQPMVSKNGNYVITFNGEIYNHLTLRSELNNFLLNSGKIAVIWSGNSDTETLLECFASWGIEPTLSRTVGMFSLALWDVNDQTLTLARDRLGEKPLYYGLIGQGDNRAMIFGSELKALTVFPNFPKFISRLALIEFLKYMYIPTPLSIYEGIFKLEAGCILTLTKEQLKNWSNNADFNIKPYWLFSDVVKRGKNNLIIDENLAIIELEKILMESVKSQLVSDVPLGALLSGGIDSSTVVALMQANSTNKVKTFTIGFDEIDFDEAPFSKLVANHLGTDHFEMRVTEKMVKEVIPKLPIIYDEPFADSSQIPTYLVSEFAGEHVSVVLSGDAADELFGGYNRYLLGNRLWNFFKWVPFTLRKYIGTQLKEISIDKLNKYNKVLKFNHFGEKVHKFASRLEYVKNSEDLYSSLVTEWSQVENLLLSVQENHDIIKNDNLYDENIIPYNNLKSNDIGLNPIEKMMYNDTLTYLKDDILCKVDRASMACSLEIRVPFLDHRLVEFSWRLPHNMKIRNNKSKWILKQVLYKYIPKKLIDRPKAGFAIPISYWLRGTLREWGEDLLNETNLKKDGIFNSDAIKQLWVEHQSKNFDHSNKLWSILMFQAWFKENF